MITLHTNFGDIAIELDHENAPKTAADFLQYAQDGHYDGLIFHRVIPGFMIQGGGMNEDMQEAETREPVKNEADNGLSNEVGTLAMARTSDPHSATAQFFINVKHNQFLDKAKSQDGWGYCVFGKVTEGMEVVQRIEKVDTGRVGPHSDVPTAPVVIERVTVAE